MKTQVRFQNSLGSRFHALKMTRKNRCAVFPFSPAASCADSVLGEAGPPFLLQCLAPVSAPNECRMPQLWVFLYIFIFLYINNICENNSTHFWQRTWELKNIQQDLCLQTSESSSELEFDRHFKKLFK